MRYTTHINILLPLEDMIALFDNPQNRMEWQPELRKMTHLSGEQGQVGAKTAMVFHIMSRDSEMIETITVRDLPHRFSAVYEMNGIKNTIENRFEALSENRSRWTVESEFKFSGMMALVSGLLEGVFKRQTDDFCKNFKAFAEK
jgi:Polyketide cyclase / dehydrase and lipid transport